VDETAEYLPMFLAEGREHLQELNLAVVRIEEQPGDQATVDEIFRIAHSMKGMSATMGFEAMAALTHQMEDVFELLRKRSSGVGRDAIDVLLECLDALERAIDSIDAGAGEQLDPEPLIARLKGLTREADQAAAGELLDLTVQLAADVMMPSVRAYMVLAAAEEHGRIVSSQPAQQDVDGFDGRTIELHVETEHELAAVEAALRAVPDVVSVEAGGSAATAVETQASYSAGARAGNSPVPHAAKTPPGPSSTRAATWSR